MTRFSGNAPEITQRVVFKVSGIKLLFHSLRAGGAEGNRTPDLCSAIAPDVAHPRSFQDVSVALACERAGNEAGMRGGLHRSDSGQ